MRHWSIGDICHSWYWLSFEQRPFRWQRWYVGFRKTYVGTTHGIVIGTPWMTIIGHRRDLNFDYEGYAKKPIW